MNRNSKKYKPTKQSINDLLPEELISIILQFTSNHPFQVNLQLVCKLWYKIYNDPEVRGKVNLVFNLPTTKERVVYLLSQNKFSKLKNLCISEIAIDDVTLANIALLPLRDTLEELKFVYASLTSKSLAIIGKNFPQLISLSITYDNPMYLDDEDAHVLVKGCTKLENLSLREIKRFPSEITKAKNLKNLRVCTAEISAEELGSIGQRLPLKAFHANECSVRECDFGFWLFSQGVNARNLEIISFSDVCDVDEPCITDAGLSYLCNACKNLKHLMINGSHITDTGMKEIAKLKKLVTCILLAPDYISDEGIKTLVKGCVHLNCFHLSLAEITDDGLKQLAKLGELKELCLKNCVLITASGVAEFLSRSKSIKFIEVTECFDRAGEKWLMNNFPHLKWEIPLCTLFEEMGCIDEYVW